MDFHFSTIKLEFYLKLNIDTLMYTCMSFYVHLDMRWIGGPIVFANKEQPFESSITS